jgi:AraC-like DNA-binding protein
MGVHERTLSRRLRQSGTSYRQELDAVRQAAAKRLLTETAMPLGAVANALGYANASVFASRFKRWTGTTPAQWRERPAAAASARKTVA